MPPPQVPHYDILKRIGGGGFGEVWLARDVMGTHRAIKVVRRAKIESDGRFNREFAGVRAFEPVSRTQEGFMDILQVGRNDAAGYFFYVMEVADDETTGQAIVAETYKPRTLMTEFKARGRFPFQACLRIATSLADSLQHLHGHGLVHRDIKPSNIIFVNDIPKLADIGLVTSSVDAATFLGSPGYIAPEGPGRPQADIFGLGKVLYEIATGNDRLEYPKPPLNLPASELKDFQEINEIILKACESDPGRRYQSADEMRKDLVVIEGGKSLRRLRQRARMFKRLAYVTAGAAVVALAGALVAQQRQHAERRGRELLEAQLLRAGFRYAGWTTNHEALLHRAKEDGTGANLFDNVAAGLVGLDLKPGPFWPEVGGSSVAFGGNGQVLFGGLSNGPAHMWSPGSGQLETLSQTGYGPVGFDAQETPLQFVPLGDGTFVLRNVRTGELRHEFKLAGEPNTGFDGRPALAMAPGCSRLAAAVQTANGGRLAVWDAASGEVLGQAGEFASAVAFSPDGTVLATGDTSGNVKLWAVTGLALITNLPLVRFPISCFAFGPDLEVGYSESKKMYPWLLAIGDEAGGITVCEAATGGIRKQRFGGRYYVASMAFSPDATLLASADNQRQLWDAATGQHLLEAQFPLDDVGVGRGVAFSSDGQFLAAATEKGFSGPSLSIRQLEAGRGIHTLRGLSWPSDQVWWSPDSRHLAALARNWELAIWEIPNGRLTHMLQVPIGASQDNAGLAFSPDGTELAFAAGTCAFTYDLVNRRLVQQWRLPNGFSDSPGLLVVSRWGQGQELYRSGHPGSEHLDGEDIVVGHEWLASQSVELAMRRGGRIRRLATRHGPASPRVAPPGGRISLCVE